MLLMCFTTKARIIKSFAIASLLQGRMMNVPVAVARGDDRHLLHKLHAEGKLNCSRRVHCMTDPAVSTKYGNAQHSLTGANHACVGLLGHYCMHLMRSVIKNSKNISIDMHNSLFCMSTALQ